MQGVRAQKGETEYGSKKPEDQGEGEGHVHRG